MNKQISIGSKITYTSAAGTRRATVKNIFIGPTAKPGYMNTWITLEVVISEKLGVTNTIQIPGDSASLQAFRVVVA